MSKMIYHAIGITGNTEKIWGHKMLTKIIDDNEVIADDSGWHYSPQGVIDEIEGKALQAENSAIQNLLNHNNVKDTELQQMQGVIDELNQELTNTIEKHKSAMQEHAESYEAIISLKDEEIALCKMSKADLKAWLDKRKVSYGDETTNELLDIAVSKLTEE